MPSPQMLAELDAICERNRAQKAVRLTALEGASRPILRCSKPLTPSAELAISNMIECLIAQQRLFIRFEDEHEVKLLEIDDHPSLFQTTTNRSDV